MTQDMLFPEIAAQLKAMRDEDQAARASSKSAEDWGAVEEIDRRTTARMKEMIAEIGWPTIPKVGREDSSHAWLLVQHADLDPAFQEDCLALMKACVPGDIDPTNVAYLEDRVLAAAGKPQLYGTQFRRAGTGATYEPYPVADPDTLDERRASLGLEPIDAYGLQINNRHASSRPDTTEAGQK